MSCNLSAEAILGQLAAAQTQIEEAQARLAVVVEAQQVDLKAERAEEQRNGSRKLKVAYEMAMAQLKATKTELEASQLRLDQARERIAAADVAGRMQSKAIHARLLAAALRLKREKEEAGSQFNASCAVICTQLREATQAQFMAAQEVACAQLSTVSFEPGLFEVEPKGDGEIRDEFAAVIAEESGNEDDEVHETAMVNEARSDGEEDQASDEGDYYDDEETEVDDDEIYDEADDGEANGETCAEAYDGETNFGEAYDLETCDNEAYDSADDGVAYDGTTYSVTARENDAFDESFDEMSDALCNEPINDEYIACAESADPYDSDVASPTNATVQAQEPPVDEAKAVEQNLEQEALSLRQMLDTQFQAANELLEVQFKSAREAAQASFKAALMAAEMQSRRAQKTAHSALQAAYLPLQVARAQANAAQKQVDAARILFEEAQLQVQTRRQEIVKRVYKIVSGGLKGDEEEQNQEKKEGCIAEEDADEDDIELELTPCAETARSSDTFQSADKKREEEESNSPVEENHDAVEEEEIQDESLNKASLEDPDAEEEDCQDTWLWPPRYALLADAIMSVIKTHIQEVVEQRL